MIRSFGVLALLCCGLAGVSNVNAANLVANPGFESGDFAGWTLSGANSSPGYDGELYGVDTADAHSGNYGAYFGSVGGVLDMSQLLTTTPGDHYVISFWLQETPGTFFPYENLFSVSFGGTTLVSQSDVSNFPYALFAYDAVARTGQTSLVFSFRDDVGYFSLDDVSVSPGVVTAPEPPSLPLLLIALFCMAWARRAWYGRRLSACSLTLIKL